MFGTRDPQETSFTSPGRKAPRVLRPWVRFEVLPETSREGRSGFWLGSVLLHAGLVVVLVLVMRGGITPPPADSETGPRRDVQMVYIPDATRPIPLASARPDPAPQAKTPTPPPEAPSPPQQDGDPTSRFAKVDGPKVPEHDEAAGTPAPSPSAQAATTPDQDPGRGAEEPPALSEAAARDLAMVSEARRLFGKQGAAYDGDGTAGPRSRPGLPAWVQPGVGTCVVEGRTVATAAARSNGYVEGIVRSSETGNPLPGAFMQILGTGYSTWSRGDGSYRLEFDPSLVDGCRTQVVRVTKPGFAAQSLVLSMGRVSDNTVNLGRTR